MISHTIANVRSHRRNRNDRLNKTHAVANPGLVICDCASAVTVCGLAATVEELDTLAADGGPLYNCRPAADASRVTCKDCLKNLAV